MAAAQARARTLFLECLNSPESRALRHLFFAERGSKAAGEPCRVERVCVLGAGTMGSGIAISLDRSFEVGDSVKIDTRTGKYMERSNA